MAYVPMEHMTNGEMFEDVHVNQLIDNIQDNHDAIEGIVIPTDYAKEETLTQGISDIRNDMSPISAAADAYNTGKAQLASAITSKGVASSVSDSLVAMATKVRNIPQQVNTRTSDFEQMIAPYPYIWNVYTVATELMQNELPSYIPS